MEINPFAVVSVFLVIVLIVGGVVLAFRAMWVIPEPNQALIITGIKSKDAGSAGFQIVTGGGTFVTPGVQQVNRLSLRTREALLATECVTTQGIPVSIKGVAIYKIGDDPASISNAARRFVDQPDVVIDRNIQNLFDGHLRSIIGGMTVEALIRERDTLTSEARKTAGEDMQKLGLVIDSLQIKDITDPTGYIKNMALPHVAEVTKQARIAQAIADQEATLAEQEALAKKADATRESEIKRAGYQAEIDKAHEESKQAGPLAQALAKQNVTLAETKTAELNADLAEKNLQATVRKPADAAAYATKVTAEAERDASISRAEAEARRIELDATAKAAATQKIGESEGAAIRAKLIAEADGIKARAEALATNQDAVISQILAENMPACIEAAASAYDRVDNMTVFDGASGIMKGLGSLAAIGSTVFPALKKATASIKGDSNGS